ncbi:AGE family epimerase/isomerase [Aestuariivirga sp.]|uniref:AGE family epimerase/isomerase n=1 Tax=Aestuariivirga sp. TaxID=2650926 RepID=UPI003784F27E
MAATSWIDRPYHRNWLMQRADALFDLFQSNAINPKGGFFDLDAAGRPLGTLRQIHATGRMVHCFAIGARLGRPGAEDVVDHGMRYLWNAHRDQQYGGYCWSCDDAGYVDTNKQAYGHAFVLLAAADATMLGHPLGEQLLADVTEVLNTRFWEEQHGAVSEEYARDWSPISDYRGQNSNMHLTEALMAAFEATGDDAYLDKARHIAHLIITRHAAALGYVVGEHFDSHWNLDRSYKGSDMFRPAGTTPGHALEWSRLLAQLWVLDGYREGRFLDAAKKLFQAAVKLGWDHQSGGFYYTLDFENRPAITHKLWWPAAEAIAAAAFLHALKPDDVYEQWYRKVWNFTASHFIDPANGGWFPELGDDLRPADRFFTGKPDIYHALQACLIPLYPAKGSLMKVVAS